MTPIRILTVLLSALFLGCSVIPPILYAPADQQIEHRATDFPSLGSITGDAKHSGEVLGIYAASGRQGEKFVTCDKNGTVLLWAGSPLQSYSLLNQRRAVDRFAYHDKTRRFVLTRGTVIDVYSAATMSREFRFDRLPATLLDVDFAPDGESLLLGAADGKVYRWKFVQERDAKGVNDRQTAFERYHGPAVTVSSVAFHPNGRVFFSGDWDGGISGWLAFDQDRYGGEYDRNVFGPRFFSEGSQRVKGDRKGLTDAIDLLKVSRDGSLLVAATEKGMIEAWKVRGMTIGAFMQTHSGGVYSVAISPSGSFIATVGRDGRVVISRIRELSEQEILNRLDRTYDHEITFVKEFPLSTVRSLHFLSDRELIAGDKGGAVLSLAVE